jgi:hypothetical protein
MEAYSPEMDFYPVFVIIRSDFRFRNIFFDTVVFKAWFGLTFCLVIYTSHC